MVWTMALEWAAMRSEENPTKQPSSRMLLGQVFFSVSVRIIPLSSPTFIMACLRQKLLMSSMIASGFPLGVDFKTNSRSSSSTFQGSLSFCGGYLTQSLRYCLLCWYGMAKQNYNDLKPRWMDVSFPTTIAFLCSKTIQVQIRLLLEEDNREILGKYEGQLIQTILKSNFLQSFHYPAGDKDCIWLLRILQVRVVKHTVVFFMRPHMLMVIWRSRIYDVVSKHCRPHSNRSQSLQMLEIRQVESFHVIDEDEVEFTVILHKTLQALQDTLMDDDSILHSCVFMDLFGDICPVNIGFYGVDDCAGMSCHKKRRETDVAAQLKDIFRANLLQSVDENEALVLAHVHHPVLAAESVNCIQNGMGISFWS